jgi:hypothetical protein
MRAARCRSCGASPHRRRRRRGGSAAYSGHRDRSVRGIVITHSSDGDQSERSDADQLKSGVTVACRYEPQVQRTYEEMAVHYGTTVLPARPAHPKDKAKVEVSVQVVERWILARLRNRTFFSLDALNLAITELCDELNDRPMCHYGQSRNQLFEKLDRPALRP